MGLPEVLQMCCLSRRSGQITFRSGESYGFIYIQHGRVLHALCGTTEGEEAIYSMLTWPGGGFSLDEDILPHKKTVTLTWEQLLFEGARRADVRHDGAEIILGHHHHGRTADHPYPGQPAEAHHHAPRSAPDRL